MPSDPRGTLLLGRRDVAALLTADDSLQASERAFRLLGEGRAPLPVMAGVRCDAGGFHIKAALLEGARRYFVSKTNANFMRNPASNGLPGILGTVLVCDADDGYPLALLDSIEITARRTAAATALAARWLAREDATTLALIGCGTQGRAHIEPLRAVRQIRRILLFDRDPSRAQRLAQELHGEGAPSVEIAASAGAAALASDICVTCTPSREFLLGVDDVTPGTFVAGIGADAEDKRELGPSLLAAATVVVDVLGQCLHSGDLHHAVHAGVMVPGDVHAELGQIVAGLIPGRTDASQITVFDSTGMALQDATTVALVFERATATGIGTRFDFLA